MNKQETAEAILVMQAWIDGEELQYQSCDGSVHWRKVSGKPLWSWRADRYRIKPPPREFWLNPDSKYPDTYTTTAFGNPGAGWIKVREVL